MKVIVNYNDSVIKLTVNSKKGNEQVKCIRKSKKYFLLHTHTHIYICFLMNSKYNLDP